MFETFSGPRSRSGPMTPDSVCPLTAAIHVSPSVRSRRSFLSLFTHDGLASSVVIRATCLLFRSASATQPSSLMGSSTQTPLPTRVGRPLYVAPPLRRAMEAHQPIARQRKQGRRGRQRAWHEHRNGRHLKRPTPPKEFVDLTWGDHASLHPLIPVAQVGSASHECSCKGGEGLGRVPNKRACPFLGTKHPRNLGRRETRSKRRCP